MVGEVLRILLVERDPVAVTWLGGLLERIPAFVSEREDVADVEGALEAMRRRPSDAAFDVALVDLSEGIGADAVARLAKGAPQLPIVVLTGLADDTLALLAMAAGAEDYLVREGLEATLLGRAIRYAIERKRTEEHQRRLARELEARTRAEAVAQRATFLAEAARVLAYELDLDAMLSSIARLSVPYIAELCVVDLLEEGGEVRRVASVHADPASQPIANALLQLPPSSTYHPVMVAIRNNESLVLNDPIRIDAGGWAQNDWHRALLDRLGVQAAMLVPLVARGRLLGIVSFIRTTTGRPFDVEQLSLAEELCARIALALANLRLMRARDDTLSVVSHDLRNPLNVIGFALASLQRPQLNEDQRRAYLEKIRRSADRMNRLIENLLDVSRIESGSLLIERSAQSPSVLAAEACEHVRPLADEKSITLVNQTPDDLSPVWVDRERILQVFGNLLGNALKFTPAGGTVTVSAQPTDGEVVFHIRDTGPGIRKEDLTRIFDRFWQVKRRDRQGAGLGLAIAKGIVQAHGGRVWVESEVGAGSTFFLNLPVAEEGVPAHPDGGAAPAPPPAE